MNTGIDHQTDGVSLSVSTDRKISYDHSEVVESGVKPVQLSEQRVILTEQDVSSDLPQKYETCVRQPSHEQSKKILRKTDRAILAILAWVYFLQVSILPSG
jgi:hypothetical protein